MLKNKNIKLLLIGLLILIAAGVGVFAYLKSQPAPDPTVNHNPPSEEQKRSGEALKEEFVVDPDEEPTPPTIPEQISIVKAYQDNELGKIVVQTKLPGSSWETCTLKLSSPSGTVIEKSAKAYYQPDYSTCAGFSIDRTEFNQTGVWSVLLSAKTVNNKVSQASGNVEIK